MGEDKIISITEEEAVNLNNGKIIKLKKKTEQIKPGKTLWNWLFLLSHLTIPILAVILTIQFQSNEQKKAERTANEEAVQNYIDKMSELLIDKKLNSVIYKDPVATYKDPLGKTKLNIAQARTASLIRRIHENSELKISIINFLIDAKLIKESNVNFLNGINFSQINLSGGKLSGINFNGTDLSNTDFSHANLQKANLQETNLQKANLSSARLDYANLSSARLDYANLNDAVLDYAQLHSVQLNHAEINHAQLYNVNLRNAGLSNAQLNGTNLSSAQLNGTNLSGAQLNGTNLSGAQLNNANLFKAELYGAYLSGTQLQDANIDSTKFWDEELGEAQHISPEQIKKAKNWEKAVYSPEFREKLGLPEVKKPLTPELRKKLGLSPEKGGEQEDKYEDFE